MSEKKFTDEQFSAIQAKISSPTVVTAAAGTGKTTMLVERVIRLISDCENRVNADSLAIMTFTVNATQHLREKLNSALLKRIDELETNGENENERIFLEEQIVRLRNASISTINAFCLDIIKNNIEKFDLPINVTIADETKIAAMQTTAINLAKQDFYDESRFSAEERNLLFYSFNFEKDDSLFSCIISTANALSSYSNSEEWLDNAVRIYDSIDTLERYYLPVYVENITNYYNKLCHYQKLLLERIKEYSEDILNTPLKPKESQKKYEERIGKMYAVKESMRACYKAVSPVRKLAHKFIKNPQIESIEELVNCAKMGLPSIDASDRTNPIKKAFTKEKNVVKDVLESLAEIGVSRSEEEQNLVHNRTVSAAFVKLIKLYRGYFAEVKRAQGYVDFSDCELMLLDKLRSDEDFREQLSERFSCVIVDEFQDCNDVQAEIFRLIGKERQFYVGDIKQSIYAFRGGNPEIMAALCDGKDGFCALPLTKNFRSRPQVVDAVNDAFTGLMTKKYGGVDYNNETKLVCGAEYPDNGDNSVYNTEIYALNFKENKETLNQADFVAQKIDELMNDRSFKITKNGELCRPKPSDFAILLRNNTHIEDYRRALSQRGISTVTPRGKNILDSEEISALINLLKVIDNPLNDKELLHVLMSPLYRFSADEIAKMKLGILGYPDALPSDIDVHDIAAGFKGYALYECLKFCASSYGERGEYGKSEAKQKAEEVEKQLLDRGITRKINAKALCAKNDIANFRRFMSNNSIVDLIRKVCADTDIYAVVCALDDSRKRVANLHRFEKIADDFVSRDGGTLCDFLRFIKQIEENKRGAIEEASVPEDAENCVRIMTFHASKGLEIPVCILAELQTPINKSDFSGNFLMNHNYTFSINYVDRKARYKADTFAHTALGMLNRQKPVGEELRLLYVAMTRAQEKLIMVGNFSGDEEVPSYNNDFYEGITPFRWIWRKLNQTGKYRAIMLNDDNFSAETNTENADGGSQTEDSSDDKTIQEQQIFGFDKDELETFAKLVEREYPNEAETHRRLKYSVTELAHRNEQMPFVLIKPAFAKKSAIKGTDVGNAYHHTMEHISLEKMRNTEDLISAAASEIQALANSEKIGEDEAKLVKPVKIAEFFAGELGQRMLKSPRIERERSFYAELSGNDIGVSDIGDNVAIQGQIDMFFEEEDGFVIVDYKTDTEGNLLSEKENYSLQVRIYAAVAPTLFGKPIKEIFLYSFSNGKAVKI